MKILAQLLSIILMTVPFISLACEVNEGEPFIYQIYIWAAGAAIGMVGYAIHRLCGGMSFRDMIE